MEIEIMLDKAENTNFEADRRTACDGQNQQLNLFLMVIFFTMIIFAPSYFFLGYTSYVVHVFK